MYFWHRIKKYCIGILTVLLASFLLGFFLTEYVFNAHQARYVYRFESEEDYSDCLLSYSFYDELFEQIDLHNEMHPDESISYAKIDYPAMLKNATLEQQEGV